MENDQSVMSWGMIILISLVMVIGTMIWSEITYTRSVFEYQRSLDRVEESKKELLPR